MDEEMYYTLDEIKNYMDDTYGEYNGDIKVDAIQCEFAEGSRNMLEFYMWDNDIDEMVVIGAIDNELDIYIDQRCITNMPSFGWDIEYEDITIEIFVNTILMILSTEYEDTAQKAKWLSEEISRIVGDEEEEW